MARAGWRMDLVAWAAAAAVSGCGGGAAPDDTQRDGLGISVPPAPLPPQPQARPEAFWFEVTPALDAPGALDALAGGQQMLAAWNPATNSTTLAPGMKVLFFGAARNCQAGTQGPTTAPDATHQARLAALTGVAAANANAALQWAPSADTPACAEPERSERGASGVYLNTSTGEMAIATSSGQQPDGQLPFFGPYPQGGQNGQGDNAHITGTFVNFRHAAWQGDPLQPWAGGTQARLMSRQRMQTARVDGAAAGVTVQVKQQMMATFYNTACHAALPTAPCQVQYLMDTAVVRAGISDWSQVSWFRTGKVWFDPVQRGIPIVSGPIKAAGVATVDAERGLPLWTSQGSASRHEPFTNTNFDVTVSFEQLKSVMRITTARQSGIAPDQVQDADIAGLWGPAWSDPAAWALLTANVAQEVYNPEPQLRAEIGGAVQQLYAGPQ